MYLLFNLRTYWHLLARDPAKRRYWVFTVKRPCLPGGEA